MCSSSPEGQAFAELFFTPFCICPSAAACQRFSSGSSRQAKCVIPVVFSMCSSFFVLPQAAVRVRLQPKIAFIPEIYLRFGREFGRAFLNEELNIDLRSVIKEHTYAELIKNDENTDKIVDDLVARFQDAAAFHKIILTEVVCPCNPGSKHLSFHALRLRCNIHERRWQTIL